FWAVCAELEMPVHRHSTVAGPPETPETGPAPGPIAMYDGLQFLKRGMSHLTLGGVFQRHPNLKFLFTGTSTTWVRPELAQIDGMYHAARREGSMMSVIMRPAVELLDRAPSDYFRRNIWIGNSVMSRADVDLRYDLGIDRIVWGSDYPH